MSMKKLEEKKMLMEDSGKALSTNKRYTTTAYLIHPSTAFMKHPIYYNF